MRRLTRWHAGALALLLALVPQAMAGEPAEAAPADAAALFQPLKLWPVELRFAPDAYAAMEPKGGGNMFSLMAAMTGAGANSTGPADLLSAAMVKHGDQNRDGRLDRAEFDSLAERWFARWDNTGGAKIDPDTLRAGLKATLDPEGTFETKFPVFLRGAEGKRNGLASAIGIEFVTVRATLVFAGTTFENAGVRYKGNGTFVESRASFKRSFKVGLNEFAKEQTLAGLTKLNLHNNITDGSCLVEPIAHALYRDAGVPAPRTSYAEVYLTVPPKHDQTYLGVYSIVENVDKDFAKDRFGSTAGAIFKPVTPNLFADLGDTWADYKQAYDPKAEPSEAQARRVIEFARLMSYATDADVAARIGDYLDLDNFARFMAVTVYLSSMDSILQVGQNYYVYLHPGTNRFMFIPWDLDHSFGRIFGNQDELAKLSIHTPWTSPNRFLERVYKTPAFKELYLARMREFSETIFEPRRLAAKVDEIAPVIRDAVKDESAQRLAMLDKAVAEGATGDGADKDAVQAGASFGGRGPRLVKAFSRLRTQSIRDQLAGRTEGTRAPRAFGPGAGKPDGAPAADKAAGAQAAAAKPQGRSLAAALSTGLDADYDGHVTRAEFTAGFGRWFAAWSQDLGENLTETQLRDAIRADILPPAPKSSGTPPTP